MPIYELYYKLQINYYEFLLLSFIDIMHNSIWNIIITSFWEKKVFGYSTNHH